MRLIVARLDNGSSWALPASVIEAHCRRSNADATLSDAQLLQWAEREMAWDDIKPHLIRLADQPRPSVKRGWESARKMTMLVAPAIADGEAALRREFEQEYGRDRKRQDAQGNDYGQWLDLRRLPPDDQGRMPYRSMVTEYAWRAFRHGRGFGSPNDPDFRG